MAEPRTARPRAAPQLLPQPAKVKDSAESGHPGRHGTLQEGRAEEDK